MKIEAGKKYKTRRGDVVFFVGYMENGVQAVFDAEGTRIYSNGAYYNAAGENAPSSYDIVSEYHEPVKRTLNVWIYLDEDNDIIGTFSVEPHYTPQHSKTRLHIQREYTIGEGL